MWGPVVSGAWGSGRKEQESRLGLAVSLKQLGWVGCGYDNVFHFWGHRKNRPFVK